MRHKTGGPAYPAPEAAHPNSFPPDCEKGMTLLDHFAGLALQSMILHPHLDGVAHFGPTARLAYEMAAAMLKARAEYLEGEA